MRFQFFGALGAPNCADGDCGADFEAMPASRGVSRIPSPRKAAASTIAKPAGTASKTVSSSRDGFQCCRNFLQYSIKLMVEPMKTSAILWQCMWLI